MSLWDKFKKTEFKSKDEWLVNQKIGDLFDFMAYKLQKDKKDVKIQIMYLDVKYTITCEKVDDPVEVFKEMMEEAEKNE